MTRRSAPPSALPQSAPPASSLPLPAARPQRAPPQAPEQTNTIALAHSWLADVLYQKLGVRFVCTEADLGCESAACSPCLPGPACMLPALPASLPARCLLPARPT